MCFRNSDINKKQNKKRQGCWSQKSGVGMHQNPHFQLKPVKKLEKSENQPQINHRNYPLFPTLA